MPLKPVLVHALTKVFVDQAPEPLNPDLPLSALQGETLSVQAALTWLEPAPSDRVMVRYQVSCPCPVTVRRVAQVPVRFAAHADTQGGYLRRGPGLYPDPLLPIRPGAPVPVYVNQWDALWLDIEVPEGFAAGNYTCTVAFTDDAGEALNEVTIPFEVMAAKLPPQRLVHARWLHADALSDYYAVPMFSDAHFDILRNYITLAVKRGVNMMLVPIHTPPLDTRKGTRRPTAQLVDIALDNGTYTFKFDKLRRFIAMCEEAGVTHYEMAHLFTQWGAYHAPQIVARVDGETRQLFGWETDALGDDYAAFLAAYLPAVVAELKRLGIAERTIFHISDEPNAEHIQQYTKAKALVTPFLQGFTIMDALSDVQFYLSGAVEHPIPGIDHIQPFLDAKVPDLWTYYCISQHRDVSNTFISLPGARTRILGAQLYLNNIHGFLQWAFNFYYSQLADDVIQPWIQPDADGFAPAGDAFQVYPGPGGKPVESLRLMQFFHAMQDLRALQALEEKVGRERTVDIMKQAGELPTFTEYDLGPAYLERLRYQVNRALAE